MTPVSNTPERFDEFVEAFLRLQSLSTLHPAEHQRCREAGERVRAATVALVGEAGTLSIQLGADHLTFDAVRVPTSRGALQQLASELDCLGIASLELDAIASTSDLHRFAHELRVVSARVLSTRNLQSIGLGDLTPTIRVRFREFGRRVGGGASASLSDGALEEFVEAACGPLQAAQVDESTRNACRRWVQKSMRSLVERVEHNAPLTHRDGVTATGRALGDVLQIAGQTLEHALRRYLADADGPGDLRHMFQSIEVATAVSEDQESARLMLDVLQEAAEDVLEEQRLERAETLDVARAATESFEWTLDELRARVDACRPAIEQMAGLEHDDRSELISILLATAACAASDEQTGRFAERLRPALQAPLTRAERQSAASAVNAVCTGDDAATLDRVLPLISAAFGDELADVWIAAAVESAAACTPEALERLWPHLANEVLLGPRNHRENGLSKALAQLARLPAARVGPAVKRVQRLSAMTTGPIAKYAFTPVRAELAPLYAELLQGRHADSVGQLLLAGLQARPPRWTGSEVFNTFAHCDVACRGLLQRMLRAGSLSSVTRELQLEAGRVIARRIETLPRERFGETWVARAIEALGQLPVEGAARALQRVVRERRCLLLPAWPGACRSAARAALARLADAGSRRESATGAGTDA